MTIVLFTVFAGLALWYGVAMATWYALSARARRDAVMFPQCAHYQLPAHAVGRSRSTHVGGRDGSFHPRGWKGWGACSMGRSAHVGGRDKLFTKTSIHASLVLLVWCHVVRVRAHELHAGAHNSRLIMKKTFHGENDSVPRGWPYSPWLAE